jgi:hypothetical protein
VEARDETIGEDKRIFFPPTRINFARAPDSSIDSDARAMRSLLCQCGQSEYAAPVQDGGSSRAFKRWGGVTRQASLIGDNPEKNSNASLFLTAIAALISEDSEVLAWR